MTLVFKTLLGLVLTLSCVRCKLVFTPNDIPEWDYLDTSVDPCDNFYNFACGNFAQLHPRPSGVNIIDHFTLLEDDLIKLGIEILSDSKHPEDPIAVKKAKSAYRACVNSHLYHGALNGTPQIVTIQEAGGMPLLSPSNETVNFSWTDIGDLVANYGIPLIFTFTVGQTTQTESVIRISADSLTNPSLFRPRLLKSYEEVLEEGFHEHATKSSAPFDVFLQTLAKILLKNTTVKKSDEEVEAELNDMATFMRQLYAGGVQDSDVASLASEVTLAQLQEWTDGYFPQLNWSEYLNKVFQFSGVEMKSDVKVMVPDSRWLYGVINLVHKTDPAVVKNFALLRVFLFQAPDSDLATQNAFVKYYEDKGYQLYPRDQYCARKILDVVDTASLSYAVTYLYQRYHYDVNKITTAYELVDNIQDTFKAMLSDLQWMDLESRQAALEKLENMLVLLAHPDFVVNGTDLDRFYDNFKVCEGDNYGNARRIRAFRQAYQFKQLVPERFFWGKSTFDTNAYYNRPNNKIVIPLSMLNPVFFSGTNPILDYSRLGSIIAHEITHGFDNNGKNYDQDGQLNVWWTNPTSDSFDTIVTCFEEQYSQYYVPEIASFVNGSNCVNENLADNGGIRESYKAFKKMAEESKIQVEGKYTLEQLFFIGYGTMWCSDESDYTLSVIVSTTNGYPPKRYRVIGSLANMREFSEAFNCPVGAPMNPEKKCQLWA